MKAEGDHKVTQWSDVLVSTGQRCVVAAMVGDINGERRDVRVRLSWRPPRLRLSDLLTAMAVVAVAVLPATHGQCAAIGPHCYCIRSQHVICNNLGNVSQVPPFRQSNDKYYRITI